MSSLHLANESAVDKATVLPKRIAVYKYVVKYYREFGFVLEVVRVVVGC